MFIIDRKTGIIDINKSCLSLCFANFLDVKIIINRNGVKKTRLAKKLSVLIEIDHPKKIDGKM
jgi:hypothetical protein